MPNVKMPLLSAGASGTVADLLTFQKRKGKQKVRYQRKQKDANSTDQAPRRKLVSDGILAWRALSPAQQAAYNALVQGRHMSGYNLFLSEYMTTQSPPDSTSRYGLRMFGFFEFGKETI